MSLYVFLLGKAKVNLTFFSHISFFCYFFRLWTYNLYDYGQIVHILKRFHIFGWLTNLKF